MDGRWLRSLTGIRVCRVDDTCTYCQPQLLKRKYIHRAISLVFRAAFAITWLLVFSKFPLKDGVYRKQCCPSHPLRPSSGRVCAGWLGGRAMRHKMD